MSTVLLDTHIFLWIQFDPDRLGSAREELEDSSTTLLLSAVSSWEVAVKFTLGRLELPGDPRKWVPDRMRRSGIDGLAVEHAHALEVSALPPHHRDPFDRLLIAQSRVESLVLATADPAMRRYEVPTLWIGADSR